MKAIVRKVPLGLSNRDGEIMVVQDAQGKCYLVVEAYTFNNAEVFDGLGSTEQIEITQAAFDVLANKSVLYRCGWCGHPTDKDGIPIHTDDPGAYVQEMEQGGATTQLLNGQCCPHGSLYEVDCEQ